MKFQNLLHSPDLSVHKDLALFFTALEAVSPLAPKHRRAMPPAIRDLSRLLTEERDGLTYRYWADPGLTSAYLRYFLPWNLQRLAAFFPCLDLALKDGDEIFDLGSGPATLPLALWASRPDLRGLRLKFTCADLSPHILDLGLRLFRAFAGDAAPWRLEAVRAPLEKSLRQHKGGLGLIMGGNVLNELPDTRRDSLDERFENLTAMAWDKLRPEGGFLSVEPGTRLGGKLITLLRRSALETGFTPLAPCPHACACPFLPEEDDLDFGTPAPRRRVRKPSGWCHFSRSVRDIPADLFAPLLELTEQAGLGKASLALSCLLLRKTPDQAKAACPPPKADLRVISEPIRLPGLEEAARYACSARGMVLLRNAVRLPSGAAVSLDWPTEDSRDPKSGALEMDYPPKTVAPVKKPAGKAGTDRRTARQAAPDVKPARTRPGGKDYRSGRPAGNRRKAKS